MFMLLSRIYNIYILIVDLLLMDMLAEFYEN
jgi:hypothetical protein